MGYTHYFKNDALTPDEWAPIQFAAARIVATTKVSLSVEYDQTTIPPQVDTYRVQFNGQDDDGHETFFLNRDGTKEFCKTNREPYDDAVVAVLIALMTFAPGKCNVGSDGTEDDWAYGIALFRSACPEVAQIQTPWGAR
jgi:hypothetical protein